MFSSHIDQAVGRSESYRCGIDGRNAPLAYISQNMTIPAMTKGTLRFFFDFGAGGCLWAGDEATRSKLGVGPLDAAVYDLQGHVVVPPRISLPSNVHSLISRLDQEYLSYLNPLYPPDPSLWTQASASASIAMWTSFWFCSRSSWAPNSRLSISRNAMQRTRLSANSSPRIPIRSQCPRNSSDGRNGPIGRL